MMRLVVVFGRNGKIIGKIGGIWQEVVGKGKYGFWRDNLRGFYRKCNWGMRY